jgi:outer membrane lipopolysaccharide assembly protein LptE/RlpB
VIVRRSIAAAAVVLVVPVLAGCGVNFRAQTDQVYNPTVGVDDRNSQVDVLNALIVSGSDGSGTVVASLVNNDESVDDTLKSVTGAGADSSLKVTTGGDTTIPAGGLLNMATQSKVFAHGKQIAAGEFVDITFNFARAGAVTVDVPVVSSTDPAYEKIPLPSGS